MLGNIAFGIFGLTVLIGIAFAFSTRKKSVDWTQILAGIGQALALQALAEVSHSLSLTS